MTRTSKSGNESGGGSENTQVLGSFPTSVLDSDTKKMIDVRMEIARRSQVAVAETALGNLAFDKQDFAGAVHHYDSALKVVPSHVEALGNRANVKCAVSDFHGAIKDTTRVIELTIKRGVREQEEKFNLAVVYYTQAEAYFHLKSFYDSLRDCDHTLDLWPPFGEALCLRGATHNALGNFKTALKDLCAALRLKPNYAMAFRHRGICLCCLGDFASSVKDLERALKLDAKDEAALAWLGKASAELRVEEEAAERAGESVREREERGDKLRRCF